MIFKPEMIDAIFDGRKTVTRRLWQPDIPCRYRIGRTYAVQSGRGKRALARILVTDVRALLSATVSDAEARREGFRSRADFYDAWHEMHGTVNTPVWRIEFKLRVP